MFNRGGRQRCFHPRTSVDTAGFAARIRDRARSSAAAWACAIPMEPPIPAAHRLCRILSAARRRLAWSAHLESRGIYRYQGQLEQG